MTISEGTCFRNCITKFNVFYPTLKPNLMNSPYTFTEKKLHNYLLKNDAKYADAAVDPWADRISEILAEKQEKMA